MENERFFNIQLIMDKALSDGQLELAKELAMEYLDLANDRKDNWNYGNAIHQGNLVLGRIALRNGDSQKAKEYLIAAGNTPGSPQLNSFGPNMRLAKELLEQGETEAVIEYIDLTKSFWRWIFSWFKTLKWKKAIRKGLVPDFRGNLNY